MEEQLLGLTEEIQKNEEERTKFESTINRYENQVESLKLRTTELEESIEQYQDQIDEFQRNKSNLHKESDPQVILFRIRKRFHLNENLFRMSQKSSKNKKKKRSLKTRR